jgi:hypothetical protein
MDRMRRGAAGLAFLLTVAGKICAPPIVGATELFAEPRMRVAVTSCPVGSHRVTCIVYKVS